MPFWKRHVRTFARAIGLSSVFVLLALAVSTTAQHTDADSAPDGAPIAELDRYPWLYLRDGQLLADDEAVVELIAVGDVMLARGVAAAAENGRDPFGATEAWLRSANVTLGNLESVIAEKGSPRPGPYRLRAWAGAADALLDAGFDVVSLANNHALDFGPEGLAETVSRLDRAGIATVGVGPDAGSARKALIVDVGGLRIAFLAFNAVPDPQDHLSDDTDWTHAAWGREQTLAAITAARVAARPLGLDAIVVSAHWGFEYELRPDPSQRDWARALLESGADLVLGHHPHVVQGTQTLNDGFVAYSLGNFVFDQVQGETDQGLALRVFFDALGLRAVQALPVWAGPQPRLMSLEDAAPLLARVAPEAGSSDSAPQGPSLHDGPLTEPSHSGDNAGQEGNIRPAEPKRIGFLCVATQEGRPASVGSAGCVPNEVPPTAQTGIYRAGAVDLTGDGLPETVQLDGENVVITSSDDIVATGSKTWRGLSDWRVVDIALGDPNDDGRGELLLALFKPDEAGAVRSHPFVLGFREGAYRILWGGSAVAYPIHEVELGDVDGDGVQELVVLEDASSFRESSIHTGTNDLRTVTVWDWHGWGFSLAWRSPPGRYRDLVLLPSEEGTHLTISVVVEP